MWGLLTTFRSALSLGRGLGVLEPDAAVPTDLGFSWRPDKPAFFPGGRSDILTPEWMQLTDWRPDRYIDADQLAADLTAIREDVARFDELPPDTPVQLGDQITRIAEIYERNFSASRWEHRPTWVIAINMTLSDAVPVTLALHRSADAFSPIALAASSFGTTTCSPVPASTTLPPACGYIQSARPR